MMSPHYASLESIHRTTHICTHTLIRLTSRSPVQLSWKLGPPLYPSPPLISSSILHDSLQSVNLELSPHDAITGTVNWRWKTARGGGRDKEKVSKQVGGHMEVWS